MNSRRKLVIALGAGALAAPLASFAQQQSKVWRVGVLATRGRPASLETDPFGAFQRGMRELGYVEGKNLVTEFRWANERSDHLPALAAELVQMKVDVIVTAGDQDVSAAQKATSTIPIVMATVPDPVASGFVKSLAHPGGNITGLSNIAIDITPKQLEMLQSMVPKMSRVAVLVNPDNLSHAMVLKSIQSATQRTSVKILAVEARTAREIENAFSEMAQKRVEGVVVARDVLFVGQVRQIAELAAKHRLPSISGVTKFAESGGLINYGQSSVESFRRAATYVDKIFKGAKPGDLPIEQPTTFELIINRKTAKALGLTIPQSLLISADKVIE